MCSGIYVFWALALCSRTLSQLPAFSDFNYAFQRLVFLLYLFWLLFRFKVKKKFEEVFLLARFRGQTLRVFVSFDFQVEAPKIDVSAAFALASQLSAFKKRPPDVLPVGKGKVSDFYIYSDIVAKIARQTFARQSRGSLINNLNRGDWFYRSSRKWLDFFCFYYFWAAALLFFESGKVLFVSWSHFMTI